ncbi:hypothetical protein MNBD_GAMMA16-431 [hydrothermal vent metagenome]|uniref:Uncharacterized protein n=1 Tax=hydrothermal vent metagenome TaxID=652676 RepID=A0A3B0YQF9_9ZZZZ
MRLHLCIFVFVLLLMPWGGWVSAKEWMPPITLSGSLGFNYRTLGAPEGRRTVSRQGLGSLYASSYIYRPWLATADMALTLSMDGSESSGGKSQEVETKSSIVSGVLNLNVLPKSRTPFNLRYSVTDTRVDNAALSSDALIVLADGDATTSKLGLTQSYIAEGGHRVRFIYDNNSWESDNNGIYEDQTAAIEIDMRGPRQRLTLNGKVNEATRSKTASRNESTLFDATHYYFPTKGLRVDTRVSAYEMERDFDVPSANMQRGVSASQVNQLSSFLFYRPRNNSPWSLSGGLRVFDMSGENAGLSNDSENLSATFGGYYQYNRRLRFDFSSSYSQTDSNAISAEVHRERVGALFQSDMHTFWKAKYHWFVDASFDNVGQQDSNEQYYAVSLGHNLSRSWFTEGGATFRTSLAQSLSEGYSAETGDNALREETSVTLNWNKHAAGGSTYVQLTGSRGVTFRNSDNIGERYMGWFQINHEQSISRRSSLSGNVSAQYVFHDFESSGRDSEITTATAQVNYRNRAIFSIPRFSFNSDLRLSRASEERGVDRYEWENRLDHAIGQLTTSLSHRIIRYDDKRYAFLFFRVLRHF